MKEFDASPELSWLFVFAHPDDELAIAAWIRRLSRANASISIVWLHAVGSRLEEAKQSAAALEVPLENCHFFDFPDGEFLNRLEILIESLKELVSRVDPSRVVCCAFEQGHLDHDAARFALSKVWSGPTLEFPEYWPYTPRVTTMNRFTHSEAEAVIQLTNEEIKWKLRLAKSFPATDIWRNLFWYEVWSAIRLRRAHLIRTERLRWSPEYDFSVPSVPERFKGRVVNSPFWKAWHEKIQSIEKGS